MKYTSIKLLISILGCLIPMHAIASSPDIEYREFYNTVNCMLVDGKFDSLNALADTLRTEKTRFKDGRWKLTSFYKGMHPVSGNALDSLWDKHEILIRQWIGQAGEKSPTPYVALASFYEARAWKHRGTGYSNTVSRSGWEGWYGDLKLAKSTLNNSAKISKKCPHWYNVMQGVALGENWKEEEYEALFEEAISREPSYYFYYFAKANFYQSRWYGNKDKLMKFVDEAVKATFDREGYTLYARIYWSAEREFGRGLFQPGNVDWEKMKSGFNFINKQYPNSIWNQNAYAHFACRAGDKQTTAEALKKILQNVNLGAWSSRREYEYCKEWALGERH